MKNRLRWTILLFLSTLVFAHPSTLPAAEAPPFVKVNKDLITVSEPDDNGLVHLIGQPGAIDTNAPIKSYVRHEARKEKVPFEIDATGAFSAQIPAAVGEPLRVYARTAEGKQSYGSFIVPGTAPVTVSPSPAVPPDEPLARLQAENEKLRADNDKLQAQNQLLKEQLRTVLLQLQDLEKLLQTILKEMDHLDPADKPNP